MRALLNKILSVFIKKDKDRDEANSVLSWQVLSVVNEARGESGWVVAKRYLRNSAVYFDTLYAFDIMIEESKGFTDFATPEERTVISRGYSIDVDSIHAFMWKSLEDAFIVRNLIRRAEGFKNKDKWQLLSNLPEPCDTLCPSKNR